MMHLVVKCADSGSLSFCDGQMQSVGCADVYVLAPSDGNRQPFDAFARQHREETNVKLYYESGTSALASHIALIEAGFSPDLIHVDIETHKTNSGDDYYQVNPKGCLPSIVFVNGEKLTETVAILDWAGQ